MYKSDVIYSSKGLWAISVLGERGSWLRTTSIWSVRSLTLSSNLRTEAIILTHAIVPTPNLSLALERSQTASWRLGTVCRSRHPTSTLVPSQIGHIRKRRTVGNPQGSLSKKSRAQGRIQWTVYRSYLSSFGGAGFWVMTLGGFVLVPVTMLARAWWLKIWTQKYESSAVTIFTVPQLGRERSILDVDADNTLFNLGVYLACSLAASIVACVNIYLVRAGNIRASRELFERMIYVVLRAPLRWLDTVPLGRILNRSVSDFEFIDSRVPADLLYFGGGLLSLGGITVAVVLVSPYMMLPSAILGFFCYRYSTRYLAAARDIKRLESTSRSPIFELYGSVLAGIVTIRSFDKAEDYVDRIFKLIDDYGRCTWALLLTTAWMSFRTGMIGAAFTVCVAAVNTINTSIDASLAGFALCWALQYSNVVIQTVRRYTGVELDMNCAERILEYIDMEPEEQGGYKTPSPWPAKGSITFEDLEVSYAPGLPPALMGLNCIIEPGQRVGIVGRTGSGKTSLTLALFRFLQASKGRITIDRIDIATLPLHQLRSAMAIIPQNPVLFSGTLRSNLDAVGQHSDHELREVLKRDHFLESVNGDSTWFTRKKGSDFGRVGSLELELNLDYPIATGGLNLSQGQRQLLCLARAILARPRIVVLDEATSAVDMKTDMLIRNTLREDFHDCTLLVVAHRLSTIIDFDKTIVLREGRMVELGTPKDLLGEQGMFWKMVCESGERDMLLGSLNVNL